jgi:hypothetical protein
VRGVSCSVGRWDDSNWAESSWGDGGERRQEMVLERGQDGRGVLICDARAVHRENV